MTAGPVDAAPAVPIRLAVVDDHPIARYGVRLILAPRPDIHIVRDVASLAELSDVDGSPPGAGVDVFLVDLYLGAGRLPAGDIQALTACAPVLIMSASVRRADVLAAIQSGASGFLPKGAEAEAYVDAILTVARGGFYLSPQLANLIATESWERPGTGTGGLTPREKEVLGLLAQGFTQRQAARRMGVAPGTVDTYLKRIRQKLGPGNRVTLIQRAERDGR